MNIKEIIRGSYFHLLAIFVVAVFLLKIGWFSEWPLNFVLFAIILGGFGYVLVPKAKERAFPLWVLWAALGIAVVIRIIPYLYTSVPLGYDPGLHKFLFEHPFGETWLKSMYPLPFSALMGGVTALVGSWFALVPLFIMLSALTGLVIYYVTTRVFDKNTGIVAACLFAVSITQFETFWYNYYKNVLGILLLLLAFLYIEDNKRFNWKLVLIGGLLLGIHQVAFFIFGMTYFFYVMLDVRKIRTSSFWYAVLNGVLIILVAVLLNIDRVFEFILPQTGGVAQSFLDASGGSGTFFDTTAYFLFFIPFIPFAVTGFLHSWRKRKSIAIATLFVLLMVIGNLIFHNRFIIYLDVFVIMYAAVGCMVLYRTDNKYGRFVLVAFFGLSLALIVLHAFASRPLINDTEFSDIKAINDVVEANATIMTTDRYYGPWIKGYVERPVIAPGLFGDNQTREEWVAFLRGEQRETFMKQYNIPTYIHVGQHQVQYQFPDTCFQRINVGTTTTLYRYTCI